MRKLEETFVKIEPSRIGQPYKYIELKCVCCRKTFFKGDIREDPDKVTGQEKPLCPNCAKHHLERLCKWKEKLQEILPELDLEDKWHVNPMMNRIRKIVVELSK
jgi:hypothetical protein